MPFHAGSLEALRVTRPEAVGLERTKKFFVLPLLRPDRRGLAWPSWGFPLVAESDFKLK